MSKIVKYGSEVNQKFLSGIDKITNVIGSTMGGKGRTVAINEYNSVHLSKDGVTVARAFDLEDPIEKMGADLIKEASAKTNQECGDGSTGVCVLSRAIYKNGLKYTSLGSNSVLIKRGIDKMAEKAIDYLSKKSVKISTKEDIKNVALVSANGDEDIAEVISDIFSKIGKNGTIRVEDGKTTKMESKIVEGCVLNSGYISPYFVTNENMECNMSDPLVLVTDKKLSNIQEIIGTLKSFADTGRPLLIIADSVEGDVISTLILSKLRGGITVCAINAPGFGEHKTNVLRDICALTGATLISDNTGQSFVNATVETGCFGEAKSIVVTKTSTTIIGGKGDKAAFDEYVQRLKTQIEQSDNEYERKKMKERLGRLTDGIGIISCGASTEAELKEKKDRVDDAFNSAKNAIESGIVAGGGIALLSTQRYLSNLIEKNEIVFDKVEEEIGARIFIDSLSAPIRTILDNAGLDASTIIAHINSLEQDDEGYSVGYDVVSDKYVNMIESGIIDPCAVIISEIKNASSIASTLLTTNSCIVERKEETKKRQEPEMEF